MHGVGPGERHEPRNVRGRSPESVALKRGNRVAQEERILSPFLEKGGSSLSCVESRDDQTRTPNSEIRKKSEARSPKAQGRGSPGRFFPDVGGARFGFRISEFFRASELGLRI